MTYYSLLAISALILILNLAFLIFVFLFLRKTQKSLEGAQESREEKMRREWAVNREENQGNAKALREEVTGSIKLFSDLLSRRLGEMDDHTKEQLQASTKQLQELTRTNSEHWEKSRSTVENRLAQLQEGNQKKLDEMKAVVDEKLQSTLEKRLGESFKLVSERLEKVHQGLGDMQQLANGVGDLKKVLTNVKTRGTWGEVQLGNLLEQMLSPQQYSRNVQTRPQSAERVEFAIRLPGSGENGEPLWLPIDAKFPMDGYEQLLESYDRGHPEEIEAQRKFLDNRLKSFAKDISTKYLEPPHTTDFAIMYLPVEGLYAEVLRRPGLFDDLQRKYRVVITGPTTLSALVNSLQMGFRTLAIEKRSSDIRALLGAVKNQFGKFGDLLEKTQKKLTEASHTIEDATRKSRHIQGRLGKVEELPGEEATRLLGPDERSDESAP